MLPASLVSVTLISDTMNSNLKLGIIQHCSTLLNFNLTQMTNAVCKEKMLTSHVCPRRRFATFQRNKDFVCYHFLTFYVFVDWKQRLYSVSLFQFCGRINGQIITVCNFRSSWRLQKAAPDDTNIVYFVISSYIWLQLSNKTRVDIKKVEEKEKKYKNKERKQWDWLRQVNTFSVIGVAIFAFNWHKLNILIHVNRRKNVQQLCTGRSICPSVQYIHTRLF